MLSLAFAMATAAAASESALHVRASVAIAPCVAPVVEAFNRTARRAVLDVGLPTPIGDADVVIGDDAEMTRALEGGAASLATSVELGTMAWVHVAPEGLAAAAADVPVAVLGGPAGRDARSLLSRSRSVMAVTTDASDLRRAAVALVPLSLAGTGARRPADVPPLQATAAEVVASGNRVSARQFLTFLRTGEARATVGRCFGGPSAPAAAAQVPPMDVLAMDLYGRAVVDWWLPQCSLERNGHNDPQQSVGPPDAARLEPDRYRGLISLGQGGYVTLELAEPAVDRNGPDIRVFQTTTNEPVTVYASIASEGPFVLLGLRRSCGIRSTQGIFSNHCDFDLRDGGLATARYVKVEDGEIYPCLAGGTNTEGADLDAVQVLNR